MTHMTPFERISSAVLAAGLAAATMALTQALPQGPRPGEPTDDTPRPAAASTRAGFGMALTPARLVPTAATARNPLAQAGEPQVGARIDPARLHRVTRPGLYGVGHSPPGSSYGVIGGRLIRYDPDSLRVQSIIREIEAVLD